MGRQCPTGKVHHITLDSHTRQGYARRARCMFHLGQKQIKVESCRVCGPSLAFAYSVLLCEVGSSESACMLDSPGHDKGADSPRSSRGGSAGSPR